ncbi:MAG: metal ABC transporter permease [Bacilli bacterium]|nr:metal ABC transporter permease [Bacilli bacterium]
MEILIEMFSYSFMVRALLVGVFLAISASLVGVSLVLRRNSMIGDGLSHVSFGAFALATVLGLAPLSFALPVVILVSFFILRLNENSKIHGDSAIALLSAGSLALGTFVISIVKGVNVDMNSYLFGSILSVSQADFICSILLSVFVVLIYAFSYSRIFAITFDESFAASIGIKTGFYNALFSILCSLVVVIGMRLVGALLISSFIIFPTLSSMQVFKSFKAVVVSSVLVSVFAFVLGLILSYLLSTPTGATIVLVHLAIFILFKIGGFFR